MGTKKQELFDKMSKITAEMAGMSVLLHSVTDIHFEIGFTDAKGHTKCVYSSTSINRTLGEYATNNYSEEDGYRIDVWEGDSPAADISISGFKSPWLDRITTEAKVVFEINKKRTVGVVPTDHSVESPVFSTEYETIFRSTSAIACRTEWYRQRFTAPEYVMDVREAPEGKEAYHVADIDIRSMTKEVSRMYDRDWLISLIRNYTRGDSGKMLGASGELADRILETYGRGKA